jgi:hypothetical protein
MDFLCLSTNYITPGETKKMTQNPIRGGINSNTDYDIVID